jgi:hypothetical protein
MRKSEMMAGKSPINDLQRGPNAAATADIAQSQIDSLTAHGLSPIDTGVITNRISAALDNPNMAGAKPVQTVMSNVAKEIADWTATNGGVIDAKALYSIRKNAVASEVLRLNPSADAKTQAKMTAGILSKVNPLIDDAIEAAGGTGWRNYLKTYSDGMHTINQMKLGAVAMDALDQSPDAFLKLVRGNKPKTVQKIFSGDYDFGSAMKGKTSAFNSVAAELERDATLTKLSDAGSSDMQAVLRKDASKFRLPALLSREATVINKGLQVGEELLDRKTMAKAYAAMRNGEDAAALMNTMSTAEKNYVLQAMIRGKFVPPASAALVNTQGQNQ